uniref:CCHC-type domain-containing protein n=1 Tax=Kalmanozyma brasiliensis (strain GHG001) TaxID=1365824 RepID=V5EU85_KALBG
MPQKVLIVGPVNGRLSELASKLQAIESKHGPFTACFVLGDLFKPDKVELDAEIKLPIPTYFYQGSTPPSYPKLEQQATQEGLVKVAPNLYYLQQKSGVVVTPDGLRVAFVGGTWDAKKYAEELENQSGVTLFSPPNPSDPLGGLPDPTARMWGSLAIARLASHACPRYHFALAPSSTDPEPPVGIAGETLDMGAFWERAPYTTDLSSYLPQVADSRGLKTVTRFVSLARFANEKKRRWFLALNLTPADSQQAVILPANSTQTPYSVPAQRPSVNGKRTATQDVEGPNYRFQESRKKPRAEGDNDVPPPGYVCRICNVGGHYIRACPSKQPATQGLSSNAIPVEGGRGNKPSMPLPAGLPAKPAVAERRQLIPVGPSNCWFCLSNPSVAKSLIVAIGGESYLAFPKGGFSHPSINTVDASHLLLVPLAHTSSLLSPAHPVLSLGPAPEEEEERRRTRVEMDETKSRIRSVWGSSSHIMLEWTLVRVRTSSRMTHFQTQLLALLSSVVGQREVVKRLDDALEALPALTVLRKDEDVEGYFNQSTLKEGEEQDGYFHLALHPLEEGGEKRQWLVPLSTTSRFPVQFVRTTLADVFELPHLADWKTAQAAQVAEDGQEGFDEEARDKERSSQFRALLAKQTA